MKKIVQVICAMCGKPKQVDANEYKKKMAWGRSKFFHKECSKSPRHTFGIYSE